MEKSIKYPKDTCQDCGCPVPFKGKFSSPVSYKIKPSDKIDKFPEHECESECNCKICIKYINSHSKYKKPK